MASRATARWKAERFEERRTDRFSLICVSSVEGIGSRRECGRGGAAAPEEGGHKLFGAASSVCTGTIVGQAFGLPPDAGWKPAPQLAEAAAECSDARARETLGTGTSFSRRS